MLIADISATMLKEVMTSIEKNFRKATTLEQASQIFCKEIYTQFDSVVLVRIFATIPFGRLPAKHKAFVERSLIDISDKRLINDDTQVLSLLGTYGRNSKWNRIALSKGHLGIPLISHSFIDSIPMSSRLLKEMGLDISFVEKDSQIITKVSTISGTFFIEDAKTEIDDQGRKIISNQQFVQEYGIESVFGFGGHYFLTTKEFFSAVIFLDEKISKQTASTIASIGDTFKSATRPFIASRKYFNNMRNNLELNMDARTKELTAAYHCLELQQETFRKINEELIKANEVKSEFISTMSHELQTPLTAIIGYAEVILEQGKAKEAVSEYVYYIYESAHHLLDLITDILDISKIEKGKMQLHPTVIDLSEIIVVLERILSPLIKKAGLTFNIKIPAEIPALQADKNKLKQILMNLLSNAIKFTPTGGVITLKIIYLTDEQKILISVNDTGKGIAESSFSFIFEKFSQLNSGITKEFGGIGLGLSITKHLVQLHGGTIWVESTVGKGSTFYVKLPLFQTASIDAS